ncbi:ATP-binding protein [Flaviaesturariibacter amylovorans]|uniref:histidine kinase n=2 Tax=Flaviaesturariibacter amylovorans TaxID=1084520 RepID=A0ABP8HH38_9BACT
MPEPSTPTPAIPEFLTGGGELGQRIRDFDWASTPLGPVTSWPQSLRTCVRIMLSSRQPIWIGWGRALIKLYNDPYKAIVGGKHPWALGLPASEVWKEIWDAIDPMLRTVMENDEGTYVESQLLIMERNGYPEETYYTFSYTPIPGDGGGTAGMICANTDDTDRIISERQLRTLTGLGKSLTDCYTDSDVIGRTLDTLRQNPQDFPYAVFYRSEGPVLRFTGATVPEEELSALLRAVASGDTGLLGDGLREALAARTPVLVEGLADSWGALPVGAWPVASGKVLLLPILSAGNTEPYGFLLVGFNPYRLLDEAYRGFFSLLSDQVATSFADVHRLDEERRRAAALAELNRAKTTFFSNISHEFRTPLTLLLGPVEDALNDPFTIPENRARLEVAYRNALRMQKLVNTLLDFSRIEAGRLEGTFSKVDICAYTSELASSFRSAIERAGMELRFECGPVNSEVYVDVDLWEKIILNLLSNAFKYSNAGAIGVQLRQIGAELEVTVWDTGIGIPESEHARIFDRFHRIESRGGRSQEGTGIGLALVRELVHLHGGNIRVESVVGKGTAFIITLPTGKEHLPADKLSTAPEVPSGAAAYVQEALRWIPGAAEVEAPARSSTPEHTVLLADDNADMRSYVARLLSGSFEVVTAADGEEAFQKMLERKPDLLLSDIMMPRLDGFGLLQQVRAHPQLRDVPVILLSARAGEEAKIEGLDAGADDYLVKPFSARELIARVEGNIRIARSRRAAERNLRRIIRQSPVAMNMFRGPEMLIDLANNKALEIWGRKREDVIGRPALDVFPELVDQGFGAILDDVYQTGKPFVANEMPVHLQRNGEAVTVYLNFIYEALRNDEGDIDGIVAVGIDVSEQVIARQHIEESQRSLNELANAVPQLVWVADPAGNVLYYNDRVQEFAGAERRPDGSWSWKGLVHPDDQVATEAAWAEAVRTGDVYQAEHRIGTRDGQYRWFLSRGVPQKDADGNVIKWFGSATDVHSAREQSAVLEAEVARRTRELQELNATLQQSNNDLQQFAHVASHDLKEPLRKVKTFAGRLADDPDTQFSDKGRLYLSKVHSAANRMYAMIEGVLNYSMINATEQEPAPVDLNVVIRSIETDLELPITQKAAQLRVSLLPLVEGAQVLLYQLFYNLVNNSLKFARAGVPPLIEVSARTLEEAGKELVEIRYADNGIGFDAEQGAQIFNAFSRLNSKDQYEGTGLGLSLCQRIAQRHGGRISATGVRGGGATFTIVLPVKQEQRVL